MAITLSDDEVFDHESKSDQERNFMAFTATTVVSEIKIADKNPSDEEFSKNADFKRLITNYARLQPKML